MQDIIFTNFGLMMFLDCHNFDNTPSKNNEQNKSCSKTTEQLQIQHAPKCKAY